MDNEWDENALRRHHQIVSGVDISYWNILIPTIFELLGDVKGKSVVDVGCGTGTLAKLLAQNAKLVVGVDESPSMIRIARQEYGNMSNLAFMNMKVEEYAQEARESKFEICVSNMMITNVPNLEDVISAMRNLLDSKGVLVLTITHPWFWNLYKDNDDDLRYMTERVQCTPFVISLDQIPLPSPTRLFHRPMQAYFEALYLNHLHVERLLEPFPNPEIEKLYPTRWLFPRFLALKCVHEPERFGRVT